MKRICNFLTVLLAVLLLTACGGGDTSETVRRIGDSELYSKAEIAQAMDQVERFFRKEFDGCKLTELRYDEEKFAQRQIDAGEKYGAEVIILLSSFDVDESGGDGSLNPNSTYTRYQWILSRTMFGWELRDWGYG